MKNLGLDLGLKILASAALLAVPFTGNPVSRIELLLTSAAVSLLFLACKE